MPLLLTVTFTLPDGRSGAVQITVLSFTYIAATADKPNRQYKLREKTNPVPCTVTAVDVPTGPNNGRIKSTWRQNKNVGNLCFQFSRQHRRLGRNIKVIQIRRIW